VRVLITGSSGFVGGHLLRHLFDSDSSAELHGTIISADEKTPISEAEYHVVDLRDFTATQDLFNRLQPHHVYHLAAQASVKRSFDAPWETLENNIGMQVSVIQAVLSLKTPPRIVIISSGEIYGNEESNRPPDETAPFRPASPYSVSKVAQDMLGLQYFLSHQLPVMRARPFNHIGPGQALGFVAPDFAIQIAEIEAEQRAPTIHVGSLTAERDFTDVRDVVRAYRLIMQHGTPGEAYNVASGRTYTIQYLLDTLVSYSQIAIEVRSDPSRQRPSAPKSWGDASRLRSATGWEPQLPIGHTLLDVLNEWRARIGVPIEN
jgi:GDP-4-dehydro-6-deoxy-D-mannose reductase